MELMRLKRIHFSQELAGQSLGTALHYSRDKKSPYIPEVKNVWDTQNFDPYEE
jgi:hypothetical protein